MRVVAYSREASVKQAAATLRVLGDERRLRIVRLLLSRDELCVCELVDILDLPQYEVSRHLAALRRLGLVSDRRDGLWAYYSISATALKDPFLGALLKLVKDRLVDPRIALADAQRLRHRLALRVGDQCVVGFRN